MIKQLNILLILLLLLIVLPNSPAYSLKKLSGSEMKTTIAQAGISVAVSNVVIYNANDAVRFTNPQDIDSYVEFGDVEGFTVANCGVSDVNNDNLYSSLDIDIVEIDDNMYFSVEAADLHLTTDMRIGEINYCGRDIGSMRIEDSTLSSFHLYAGAHNSGFDIELGFASRTELIEFQYNDAPLDPSDTGTLAIAGLTFANSFTGTDGDPSTWVSEGEFLIGSIGKNKELRPAVIDISGGSDDNPNAHISVKIGAIEGSVRVANINFGGNDMGHVIMDGINITKFDIEFPGRGLGRPQ